jgi:hypothetical protein
MDANLAMEVKPMGKWIINEDHPEVSTADKNWLKVQDLAKQKSHPKIQNIPSSRHGYRTLDWVGGRLN